MLPQRRCICLLLLRSRYYEGDKHPVDILDPFDCGLHIDIEQLRNSALLYGKETSSDLESVVVCSRNKFPLTSQIDWEQKDRGNVSE